jgi:hypothetical protein
MKERLHIHVTIMQAIPQEQQLPLVFLREKQGFFTTLANLLYAALTEDGQGLGTRKGRGRAHHAYRRLEGIPDYIR